MMNATVLNKIAIKLDIALDDITEDAILVAVTRQRELLFVYRKALQFYGDKQTYLHPAHATQSVTLRPIVADSGMRARTALAEGDKR